MNKVAMNELINDVANHITENSDILDFLLRQPAVKAQAYFWNYSSRRERRKAIKSDMDVERSTKQPT